MNKRGDITVTVLTLGIIAICFFTLFTFYLSGRSEGDNFNFAGRMTLIKADMEFYMAKGKIYSLFTDRDSDAKGSFLYIASTVYNPLEIKYYFPEK